MLHVSKGTVRNQNEIIREFEVDIPNFRHFRHNCGYWWLSWRGNEAFMAQNLFAVLLSVSGLESAVVNDKAEFFIFWLDHKIIVYP